MRPGTRNLTPQCLYRFYDVADRLLYIGISCNLGSRWEAHTRGKDWWRDVVRATVEHHPSRPAVFAAEKAAIKAERPIHNVVHNRVPVGATATAGAVLATSPDGIPTWEFTNRQSRQRETAQLWLYWEIDGDSVSDLHDPAEIDAVGLWKLWRCEYPPTGSPYGPETSRIFWYVMGDQHCEMAPGMDLRGLEGFDDNFLDFYTWPTCPLTGRDLRWSEMPVVDKAWRVGGLPAGTETKGGFIQEVTGWKPSPYQPFVDIAHLEQLARL